MKQAFNIAIHGEHARECFISLEQDGQNGEAIILGGTEYSFSLSGDDSTRTQIIQKLKENFTSSNKPVTKDKLKQSLEQFGIVEVSTKIEKLKRSLNKAKLLGKGLESMSKRFDEDEARGRIMADTIYINLYMEVKADQDDVVFTRQKEGIFRCWKLDKKTNLSLSEWESYKRKQWEKSGSESDFLPWVYKEAWKQSGTKDDMFTWFLRQDHQRFQVKMPFDAWKKAVISDITKYYGQHFDSSVTQAQILESFLDQAISGLNLPDPDFIAFNEWEKAKSTESFEDWHIKKDWEKSDKSLSLSEYKASRIHEIEQRWEGSGLKQAGLDFIGYRKMQDPTFFDDTGLRAFIHCDAKTRELFHLSSTPSGKLIRNNQPFSTEYETTLHSGKGYAIFVIGPDEKIYTGSHIQQVFHHSSFLSNAATLAAGEVRMGLDCSIQYAKDTPQLQSMIKEFTKNNKDPYKIQFLKNENDNTWTIAGEDENGKMQVLPVASGSELALSLADPAMKNLTFAKRATILEQAASLLGRTNPTQQVTLLSSKSGHYQPQDEENYFMLKLWEKHGVDLDKTPFTSLSSSKVYRSAREYLNEIEPRMRARQQSRLFVEVGGLQDYKHNPISSCEKTVIINAQNKCYEGGLTHPGFTHTAVIQATKLPGFKEGTPILKKDVQSRIKKLKANIAKATARVEDLNRLIKKKSRRMRGKRDGRLVAKENELSRIEKMRQDITLLERALLPIPEPGKQAIKGGGVMTINDTSEIIKIDARIGNYALTTEEVEMTLLTLKGKGVKLENVRLITYDESGVRAKEQNANKYLIDNNTLHSSSHTSSNSSQGDKPHTSPASITARYKASLAQQDERPTASDEKSSGYQPK